MIVFVRVPSWWERRAAHPENVMSPLDIGYAVALLARHGIPARIIDLEAEADSFEILMKRLREHQPSVLFLHAITPGIPHALRIARYARDHFASLQKIVLIGQHASVDPHSILDDNSPIDLCLRGEFEADVVSVVTESTPPSSAAYRHQGQIHVGGGPTEIRNLDDLPWPVHERFRSRRYRVFHPTGVHKRWRWGFILSSRGCPHRCIYCSPTLRNSYGKTYRVRSTIDVVDELAYLDALGFTIIHFKDDIFTLSRDRTASLCEAILSRGLRLRWTAQTRPDAVDLPLLTLMKRAGCMTLGLGVESGSERMVRTLQKGNRVQDARNAFRWARQVGIRTVGFFLLGSPQETEQDILATHALMRELRPNMIQVAFFTPYPGAPVHESVRERHLEPQAFSHYNRLINLSQVSDEALRSWQRKLYWDFLMNRRFIAEYLRFETIPALVNLDQFLPFLRLSAKFLTRLNKSQ